MCIKIRVAASATWYVELMALCIYHTGTVKLVV